MKKSIPNYKRTKYNQINITKIQNILDEFLKVKTIWAPKYTIYYDYRLRKLKNDIRKLLKKLSYIKLV